MMIYLDKDETTGKEYSNDLSTLPYVQLTKDTLQLASQLLTDEEFGQVMRDLITDLYLGGENVIERNRSRSQNAMYSTFCDNIGRLSRGYFKKCRNLKNNKINK